MWSREPPKEPGYYWIIQGSGELELVQLEAGRIWIPGSDVGFPARNHWWSSRIYEPYYDLNELLQNEEIEETGGRSED